MKLRVMQSNLLPALTTAVRAINHRTTLPVLEGVLLEAEDAHLVLHSTNLEVAFRIPVPAQIDEPGRVVIKGKTLLEIVKNAPKDGLIEISSEPGTGANVPVVVLSGRVTRKLNGIDAEEYPAIELPPQPKQFTVNARDLRLAIGQVVDFALPNNPGGRPILTGVELSASTVGLRLTAANNYSMGTTAFPIHEGEFPLDTELVIPAKSLTEVEKLITKDALDLPVTIQYGERNQVWFDVDNIRLVSHLIDGHYPNWEQVYPVEGAHSGAARVVVDKLALHQLVQTVNGSPTAALTLKPDRVEVTAKPEYDDEISASIDAEGDADFMVWGFTPAQLRLITNSAPGKQLVLYMPGTLSPALVYSPDHEARYTIMPVKL